MEKHQDESLKDKSVLLLGAGDLSVRLAKALLGQGAVVTGVRRDPRKLPPGVVGRAADYARSGDLDFLAGVAPDYAVLTLKPLSMNPEGYRQGFVDATRNFLAGCGEHRLRGVIAVSSTRVYAENEGGWVDESSPLAREGEAAKALIEAENLLRHSRHPVSVVRCSGIYGDPYGRLLGRIAEGRLCPPQPLRYGNRVHREDVSAFLHWVLTQWEAGAEPAQTYLLSDCEPAPQYEVEQWLATQLGVQPGPEQAPLRGTGHRRCDSKRVQKSGFRFRHPDYHSGYRAVLDSRSAPTGRG